MKLILYVQSVETQYISIFFFKAIRFRGNYQKLFGRYQSKKSRVDTFIKCDNIHMYLAHVIKSVPFLSFFLKKFRKYCQWKKKLVNQFQLFCQKSFSCFDSVLWDNGIDVPGSVNMRFLMAFSSLLFWACNIACSFSPLKRSRKSVDSDW